MRAFLVGLVLLLSCSPVFAADLAVSVRSGGGRPVADVVVSVYPAAGGDPVRPVGGLEVEQRNLQFQPFVLVVPVGSEVGFPNRDAVRHHVYSFSPARRFELKLYGKDETRSVTFDKAGVVALGCNIHDSMVAFIKVVDTAYAAKTDAAGAVVIRGLPPGPATVRVWHPYLRQPENEIVRQVVVRDGRPPEAFVAELRTPPSRSHAY